MSVETEHFFFDDTVFTTVGRRTVGRPPGQKSKVGIESTSAQCKACGESWHASAFGPRKINAAAGGILMFTCPGCGQEETVRFSAFL